MHHGAEMKKLEAVIGPYVEWRLTCVRDITGAGIVKENPERQDYTEFKAMLLEAQIYFSENTLRNPNLHPNPDVGMHCAA